MARPTKQGIDYFPMDVDLDQDDKLGMIIGEFGEKGERLWIKLLSWIYKQNGYYTEWNEDAQLRFLRRYNYCGFSMSFVNEVVPRFVKWGLLDQSVFNTFHILTSIRIQKTWLDASRKRKDREINGDIWLLEVIDGVAAEETNKKAEETIQSKVKKSKEDKSDDKAPLPPNQFGDVTSKNISDLMEDCLNDRVYFVEHVCRQTGLNPDEVPKRMKDFNEHLSSLGVTMKTVADYRQHAQNWIKKRLKEQQITNGSQVKIKVK